MPGMSVDEMRAHTSAHGHIARLFDIRIETMTPGEALARLPFRADNNRHGDTIAGPAIMALADYGMYAAVLSLDGSAINAVTATFNANFLRRPAREDLLCRCRVLRMGRRLAFLEAEIRPQSGGDAVAQMTGAYAL